MVRDLEAKNATLEQSNQLMEKELTRCRKREADLCDAYAKQRDRLFELEHRGFWRRVFNII